MTDQISTTINDKKLSSFHGGLKLPSCKEQSTTSTIARIPQVTEYIVPLQQHIGSISQPLVKPGDKVLKGQMLAQPGNLLSAAIHAPVSGTVTAIKPHELPHISGLKDECIIIENDFQDRWVEQNPIGDDYNNATSSNLRKHIRDAGIVGLGGATFPSSVKQTEINVETLILNGVECEPYISCDDALMREHAEEVVSGADIIGHIIKARRCIIAIEDNKPEAIKAMRHVVDQDGTGFFSIRVIPTVYPSGGEKQLIQLITGLEVPKNRYPAELNVLCHNVATAYAIHKVIYHDEPLISRVTTITGPGVKQPQNIEALIGTPMSACIEYCGGYQDNSSELIMGGPMMGFSLPSDTLPVVKATNCLLVTATQKNLPTEVKKNLISELLTATDITETKPVTSSHHQPCIRCGKCVDVCPVRLLPQQLYWYSSSKNIDRLHEHNLFDCIECGCCAYVCPSDIPLISYYRFAKTTIRQQERERKSSDISRQRHESHTLRLETQKREREEKLRKKREMLKNKTASTNDEKDSKRAAIAAALARSKAKKALRDNKDRDKINEPE